MDIRGVKRGEIWTASGSGGYAGKPRPVVVIQGDEFGGTKTLTLVSLTTDPTEADLFRILIEPDGTNGLRMPSRLMVDKITTLPRSRFGRKVGRLAGRDMRRLDDAISRFLGLPVTNIAAAP